jgi:hypothetical protein
VAARQAGVGWDHRGWPLVNCGNDLGVVDPAQVRGGDPEVGMPELALYDQEQDPLAGHLNGVRVPQLVVVPTSAQPPLGRPGFYAGLGEKVRARWDVGELISA